MVNNFRTGVSAGIFGPDRIHIGFLIKDSKSMYPAL